MIIIRSGMFKFEIIVFKFELSVLTKMLFRKFFYRFVSIFQVKLRHCIAFSLSQAKQILPSLKLLC